ncbi:unnamed protein product [Hymenolepis diminuta]|uniref:Uncharacterized protein n=1 Tax=Hymenolepis diminuta TaxID=6216 RepID=A0A564Y293_HYMDI|nr:unnamed protein product [Hymenolepis diminuta]VUZ43035.1 unnamed protein product [Hymenolepis diminuta]VUZ45658.1 unnamed protein product [Hymenolepis diminuta]
MGEIPDVVLSMYRTTPHQVSKDRNSAETLLLHAPRKLLQPAQRSKCMITDRMVHGQKVSSVRQSSVKYEVDADDQTWVYHRNHPRPRCAANSSKLEIGSLDIIMDVFRFPPLRSNITPEINPAINRTLVPNVPGNTIKDSRWIQHPKYSIQERLK